MTFPLSVKPITAEEHRRFIRSRASVSFLQTPAWAEVKTEWRAESLGWFAADQLVGAGLVLYRKMPKLTKYLAYLPEGPVIDWHSDRLGDWIDPMRDYLKANAAFGIRMGPPVVGRRWHSATIKAAIADETLNTLTAVPADEAGQSAGDVRLRLTKLGWKEIGLEGGFAAGQPKYNFQLPLAGCTEDDVLAGMNQLWRRNIKKAAKQGVEISVGSRDDLADFHTVYAQTAARDGFTPRPLHYFETMYDALNAEAEGQLTVYLAHHDGDLVAATIMVRVGDHAWYSYGASTTAKREVRGSNAIQWQMIRDSLATGAAVYDMRGITDTIAADDPHLGLIQFKVGTGGEAVEYLGEWDLPLSKPLYFAFATYLKRRR